MGESANTPAKDAALRRAYAVIAAAVGLLVAVNISTLMHDAVAPGRLPAWEPVVWEVSSGVMLVAFAFIPLLAMGRAPFCATPWPRLMAAHLAASLVFSVCHVTGMVLLRKLIYSLVGERYVFGLNMAEFFYEYRKDLVVYALMAAIFWVASRLYEPRDAAAPAQGSAPAPAPARLLEIRDGSRIVSAPLDEVLYARAEGNYVEFTLADGRKPLMRATLAAMERQLASDGFVRTHRSWLVSLRHVRESAPTGSGDFTLRMTDGAEAPLSRRYAQAVDVIRRRQG